MSKYNLPLWWKFLYKFLLRYVPDSNVLYHIVIRTTFPEFAWKLYWWTHDILDTNKEFCTVLDSSYIPDSDADVPIDDCLMLGYQVVDETPGLEVHIIWPHTFCIPIAYLTCSAIVKPLIYMFMYYVPLFPNCTYCGVLYKVNNKYCMVGMCHFWRSRHLSDSQDISFIGFDYKNGWYNICFESLNISHKHHKQHGHIIIVATSMHWPLSMHALALYGIHAHVHNYYSLVEILQICHVHCRSSIIFVHADECTQGMCCVEV